MKTALDWAKNELELLNKASAEYAENVLETDEEKKAANKMQEIAAKNTYELIKVFAEQGHTADSASYILQLFEQLVNWVPLTPLTGEDGEWQECTESELKGKEQNTRFSSIFRDKGNNDTAYDQNGYYFYEPGSDKPFMCRESRKKITFPCEISDLAPIYIHLRHKVKDTSVAQQLKDKEYTVERKTQSQE